MERQPGIGRVRKMHAVLPRIYVEVVVGMVFDRALHPRIISSTSSNTTRELPR